MAGAEGLGGGEAGAAGLEKVGLNRSALIWRWHAGAKGGVYEPHIQQNGRRGQTVEDFDGHLPRHDLNGRYCMCILQSEWRDARGRFASGEQAGSVALRDEFIRSANTKWDNAVVVDRDGFLLDRDSWLRGLTPEANDGVAEYMGNAYKRHNRRIRGQDPMDRQTLEFMDRMDAAIAQGKTIQQETRLFRGVRSNILEDFDPGNWEIGSVRRERSYFSTSIDVREAEKFATKKWDDDPDELSYVLEVIAPPGKKFAYGSQGEREYVFDRGTTDYRVISRVDATPDEPGIIRVLLL